MMRYLTQRHHGYLSSISMPVIMRLKYTRYITLLIVGQAEETYREYRSAGGFPHPIALLLIHHGE